MCESINFFHRRKGSEKICLQDGVQGIFLLSNLPCDFNKAIMEVEWEVLGSPPPLPLYLRGTY